MNKPLRFPDLELNGDIPSAGVDFVNHLQTGETVSSATVECSVAGVVDPETVTTNKTEVLFEVVGAVAGDVVITVGVVGSLGSKRFATIDLKVLS